MTTQKVQLALSRDIAFNKLVLSQANVRRIKTGVSIEELAEDIARRGLLQSLNVRAVTDAAGNETGMYEIPAGGRRYRALELLVKHKRLAKTALVPCVVREGGIAEEDSLAENVQRAALHPLDQFRAFQALRENGISEDEIAARFFVAVTVVRQRLKLAGVSAALLDVYADDGMTLEQLMAFSVTDDHERQDQVWAQIQSSWSKEPYVIRRMLTEKIVRVSERRVQFVGLEAFQEAGGSVMRDLFTEDNGGWIGDVALLDRLVAEKLDAEALLVAAEGWKWVEKSIDFPYGHTNGLRQIDPVPSELSDERQVALGVLLAEQDELEAQYGEADELPEEVDQRLGELEAEIAAFDHERFSFLDADKAVAGAFVSIASNGGVEVERGFVRAEDEADLVRDQPSTAGDTGTVNAGTTSSSHGESADAVEEEDESGIRPLPDRLLIELTAYRTLALRDAIAVNPSVALTALLHKLCLDAFGYRSRANCLEAHVRTPHLGLQSSELKEAASVKSTDLRHQTWKAELPNDESDLWTWLADLEESRRLALLAHCVSFGVNALYEKPNPYSSGLRAEDIAYRIGQADRISRAVQLNMVEAGWRPTVENYLGRVTKPRILEAVREARGEQAALLIEHLKKPDMALEAQRLLDGAGWLPEPLRTVDLDQAAGEIDMALPGFLTDEADTPSAEATADLDDPYPVAAE